MSEPILKISDLKVNYGGIEAVKGISFEVPQGEIVTLIGANGAGKSSTLRSIAGLVKPRSGEIGFQGESITGKSPNYIVSKGITLVPEGRRIFPDLSVVENLRIGAYLRSDDLSDDLNWVYDLFPRLKERSWQAGGTLSGGEQQMLAVGRALMSRPKVIMTLNTLELNAYCCDRCGEVRFFNAQHVERPSEKATDMKTLYAGESDKALRRILDGTSYKEEAKRAARELLAERHNGNEAD